MGVRPVRGAGAWRPARVWPLALAVAIGLTSWTASAQAPATTCPPPGTTRAALQALAAAPETIAPERRPALAVSLLPCLAAPDPELRDQVAFEAISAWLRAGSLAPAELRALRARLEAMLDAPDPDGVAHPFAALALAEVARTDRIAPWMTDAERSAMVARAAEYLRGVRDYRGFDPGVGWRHGVAHGADWLMQLALDPALSEDDIRRILPAVASQVAPDHAYVFGEPERLLRPVLVLAGRGAIPREALSAWFLALPQRLGAPAGQAWRDPAWLARRHDLVAFLDAAYVAIATSDDAVLRALLPAVAKARAAID